MNRENRTLRLLGISNQKTACIRLVNGVVKVNPHIRVLCPVLARGRVCNRGANSRGDGKSFRPKFLVRNFNDPSLELWACEGCPDFLLRARIL